MNNREEKEQFFAIYYGQEVLMSVGINGQKWKVCANYLQDKYLEQNNYYLLLKPLHAITEDDLFAATGSTNGIDNHVDYFFGGDIDRMLINLGSFECDILRSLGYAAPFRGISVEEQIKSGAIKLIEQ